MIVAAFAVDVFPFVPVPVIGLCVSVTVNENVYVAAELGAVNVGCATFVADNVTAGPAVWLHA